MRSLLYAITVIVPTEPGKVNQRKTFPSRSLVWVVWLKNSCKTRWKVLSH